MSSTADFIEAFIQNREMNSIFTTLDGLTNEESLTDKGSLTGEEGLKSEGRLAIASAHLPSVNTLKMEEILQLQSGHLHMLGVLF
jgi:hypothetical protein